MVFYVKIFGHVFGKKHLQAAPYWLPSIAAYGSIVLVGFFWITDIQAVMGKIPFYKNKFAYPYEDDKKVYVKPREI